MNVPFSNPSIWVRRPGGYILLEVMMATAIFALVAVALAGCLNETISAALRLKRETRIAWSLDSRLAETRMVRLNVGKETSKADDTGVVFEKEVSRLEFKTRKNQFLSGMYNIRITARWMEQNHEEELFAQTYVYRP